MDDIKRTYLKDGLESWFELGDHYQRCRDSYRELENDLIDHGGLVGLFVEAVQDAQSEVLHQVPKDWNAEHDSCRSDEQYRKGKDLEKIAKAAIHLENMTRGRPAHEKDEPNEKINSAPPYLRHYQDELKKLADSGVAELTEDLHDEAKRVGQSLVYTDYLRLWIEGNGDDHIYWRMLEYELHGRGNREALQRELDYSVLDQPSEESFILPGEHASAEEKICSAFTKRKLAWPVDTPWPEGSREQLEAIQEVAARYRSGELKR